MSITALSRVHRMMLGSLTVGALVAAPLLAETAAVAEPATASATSRDSATPTRLAAAAEPALLEYQIPAGYEANIEEYGADSPANLRIEVGPSTTTLVLGSALPARINFYIFCRFQLDDGSIMSTYFEPEEWNSTAVHSLAVPAGTFAVGGSYRYTCDYGEQERDSWSWTLSSIADAPATVTLDTDPSKLVTVKKFTDYTTPDTENRDAKPGDHLRITGAPGAWGDPALNPTVTVTIADESISGSEVPVENVVLSADSSTIDLYLPASFPADFANSFGRLTIQGRTFVPGTDTSPAFEVSAYWDTNIIFPKDTQVPTTISLRLNRPVGTPKYPVKAIITLRAPQATRDPGPWQLYLDGEPLYINFDANPSPLDPNPRVDRDWIDGGRSTTFSVTLPKMRRGTHTVRAEFRGTAQRAASTSEEVPLLFFF